MTLRRTALLSSSAAIVVGLGLSLAISLSPFPANLAAAQTPHQQHAAHGIAAAAAGVPLFDGLGTHHHAIGTRVPMAQRYFDQGLTLAYGFNHAEAIRSFEQATRLDPDCAMCWWGIAWSYGPNINMPMMEDAVPPAWEALQKAVALAPKASDKERAYVEALAKRYGPSPVADRSALDRAFADAMRDVARRYPDDVDAATIFAEAVMDTMPWEYWTETGAPKPGTEDMVAALESAMAREPMHPGANHYYIHAVEAIAPERAVVSAERLRDIAPNAGHLVHMSAHVFLRVGRYYDASLANERAIESDEGYLSQTSVEGAYPLLYYSHNMHFLAFSAAMEGRSAVALANARKLVASVPADAMRAVPELESFQPTALFVLARFGRWDEILAEPQPPADLLYPTAMWHYARGLAFVAKKSMNDAAREAVALRRVGGNEMVKRLEIPFLYAASQIEIASAVLDADIAAAGGDVATQEGRLKDAIAVQDRLPYMEPPYWYFPVRQFLGAALLHAGRAGEAEAAYREDLKKWPLDGWSLLGLAQSLDAQRKPADAARAELAEAWKRADVTLAASRF